jgi:hypothetical protein
VSNLGHTDTDEPVGVDVRAIVEGRLLITGSSGAGKSYVIRKLLEATYGQVQHIVFDCEGDFVTLREKFDYLLVGNNGDLSFDPERGDFADRVRKFAQQLRELRASAIIDLSDLRFEERDAFIAFMLDALIEVPRKLWNPCFVVIDEAHLFAPQNGSTESLSVVKDLMTRGRKRGLGGIPATQRLSELNKTCAEVANKLIGRTGLDVDQKRAAGVLGLTTAKQREGLALLQPGTFWAYGPAFSAPAPKLITIDPVETRHPQLGDHAYDPPPAPEGVRGILAALATTVVQESTEGTESPESSERTASVQTPAILSPVCDHEPVIAQLERDLFIARDGLADAISDVHLWHDRYTSLWIAVQNASASASVLNNTLDTMAASPRPEGMPDGRNHRARVQERPDAGALDGRGRDKPPARGSVGRGSSLAGDNAPTGPDSVSAERPEVARGHRSDGGRSGAQKARAKGIGRNTEDMTDDEVKAYIDAKIAALPGAIRIEIPAAEVIRHEYQGRAVERIIERVGALKDDEREAVRFMLGQGDRLVSNADISKALSGYQGGAAQVKWGTAVKGLVSAGVVSTVERQGSKPRIREWVEDMLGPHSPTAAEVEETYQAVLGRIAGAQA